MAIREIQPEQLRQNVFEMIGKQWTLITAADRQGKVNAMTASWGGLGVLWSKNVAYIFVRPQRYTHELLDSQEVFTPVSYTHLDVYKRQHNTCAQFIHNPIPNFCMG